MPCRAAAGLDPAPRAHYGPLPMTDDLRLLQRAAELASAGTRFAQVTVVRTSGSTPRKAGAKMLVTEHDTFGTVGGGRLEIELVAEARAAIADGKPRLVRRHLTHELAMCCGGEVDAFVEPLGQREHLVLVGAGHIHQALAPIAAALGFEVTVADDLEELASPERFPSAARLPTSFSPKDWGVPLDQATCIVIATRDHAVDQDVLEQLARLGASPRYLGVIGSRRKLAVFKQRLEARGIDEAFIARVRGPIGVDVGAETPAEIAVSVAAELVLVRHLRDAPRPDEAAEKAP